MDCSDEKMNSQNIVPTNQISNNERTDVKLKMEISNLEKRLADLNEKLSYSKFNLEKLHCDLILTTDPEFLVHQNNLEVKCENCVSTKETSLK